MAFNHFFGRKNLWVFQTPTKKLPNSESRRLANQKSVRWIPEFFSESNLFFPRNLKIERIRIAPSMGKIKYYTNQISSDTFSAKVRTRKGVQIYVATKACLLAAGQRLSPQIWSETDDVKHLLESQSLVTFWIIFAATKIHLPTTCEAKNTHFVHHSWSIHFGASLDQGFLTFSGNQMGGK